MISFTFEQLTGAAGIAASAAFAMVLVQLLKAVVPALFEKVTGALVAFVILAILYLFGAIVGTATGTLKVPDDYLTLLLGFVAAATAALGMHNVVDQGTTAFVQPQTPTE